jgi:hypothetical protein
MAFVFHHKLMWGVFNLISRGEGGGEPWDEVKSMLHYFFFFLV